MVPARPERRETVVESVACDLCGRTGGKLDAYENAVEWPNTAASRDREFSTVKVTLTLERSNKYPEGGWGTIRGLDCCPDCFESKIVPLFREAHVKQIDY
jgi:hypothetical protein